MLNTVADLVLASAENAFLQVTVFVGFALIVFGYINYLTQGRFIALIQRHKRYQPVMGAFLGLTPGCGGAIFVMPLYINRSVSFGTVVATLAATMGDAAFVLIAALPLHFVVVSTISFVVAIAMGYLVDYLGIEQRLHLHNAATGMPTGAHQADHTIQELVCDSIKGCHETHLHHIGHTEGDPVDIALHHHHGTLTDPGLFISRLVRSGSFLYWGFLVAGFFFGTALLLQVDFTGTPAGVVMTVIGIAGTVLSILLMAGEKKTLGDDTFEESELKLMSLKQTFIHNAHETAFAGTWVFFAYLVYEIAVVSVGGGNYTAGEAAMQQFMSAAGLTAVIIGALVGIVPGCGIQILYISLFIKGWFPFAALVANAISQDGDALFPLLAMDRKSSFWATMITTIPALIIGLGLYWLETGTGLFDSLKVLAAAITGLWG